MKGYCDKCLEKQKEPGNEQYCCVLCALRGAFLIGDIYVDTRGTKHVPLDDIQRTDTRARLAAEKPPTSAVEGESGGPK